MSTTEKETEERVMEPFIITEVEEHICKFHKAHPGVSYTSCTCYKSKTEKESEVFCFKNGFCFDPRTFTGV